MLRTFIAILTLILSLSFSTVKAYEEGDLAALVIDASDGTILYSLNSEERLFPASLTKVMTIYTAFSLIKVGALSFDDIILATESVTKVPNLQIHLEPWDEITVRDAIISMIVHSANDSAVAIAEHISNTEADFATLMNSYAKIIGMENTNFMNASGLHDPNQYTTAVDMAKLALRLQKEFPDFYKMFSTKSFRFKNITYNQHNNVVLNYNGATGLKTGYVAASGFNIIASAQKDSRDVIGVVLQTRSKEERDFLAYSLLDYGLAQTNLMPKYLARR